MERIPGGKARGGRCPRNVDKVELARGITVELEHTANRRVAREIACDHLTEDARYYSKLATVHLDGGRRRPRGGAAAPEWVVYQMPKADALRWDSKAIMSVGDGMAFFAFPKSFDVPASPDRVLIWQGAAPHGTDAVRAARAQPRTPHLGGGRRRAAAPTTPALSTLPEAEHAEWVAQQAVTTALRSRDAAAIKRAKDAHADAVEATEQAWWRLPAETRARMRETGEGPPGLDVETRTERAAEFKARRPGLRGPGDTFTVYERNELTGHANYVGTFTSQVDAQAYVDQQAARSRKFATFEVWTGTPKAPRKPVGPQARGLHGVTDPRRGEAYVLDTAALRKGDTLDDFGTIVRVAKVNRDGTILLEARAKGPFGVKWYPDRLLKAYAMEHMRTVQLDSDDA